MKERLLEHEPPILSFLGFSGEVFTEFLEALNEFRNTRIDFGYNWIEFVPTQGVDFRSISFCKSKVSVYYITPVVVDTS